MIAHRIDGSFYDAVYYAHAEGERKSNYQDYGPYGHAAWQLAVADIVAQWFQDPIIDVGGAFGHVTRALRILGRKAWTLEHSDFAFENRVTDFFFHQSALNMTRIPTRFANTILSTDLLEHFVPEDTVLVMEEMKRVMKPGGVMVHLVGCTTEGDVCNHYGDVTHLNHEPLQWYIDEFKRLGLTIWSQATQAFNRNKAWANTDWNGRWIVVTEGGQ